MELTKAEAEAIGWLLSTHWEEFSQAAEEFMSVAALHRLAEKFRLEEQKT